jgi:hypothetical protein
MEGKGRNQEGGVGARGHDHESPQCAGVSGTEGWVHMCGEE